MKSHFQSLRSNARPAFLSLLLALTLNFPALAAGVLKVGDPAPLLESKVLLQAAGRSNLVSAELQGKIIVLEFWATWCGPCVQAIPHLNDLADTLRNEPIQFVAVTDEDEATIRAFLKKKPVNAWVALDTEKAMHKAYGVTAIPQTVVIGKDGKIAALTYPFDLTEAVLKDLLADKSAPSGGEGGGGTVGSPAHSPGSLPPDIQKRFRQMTAGNGGDAPLFQVLIRRATDTSAQYGFGGRGAGVASAGVTLREMIARAFGPFPDRILVEGSLPEDKYDFIINPGRGRETDSAVLLQEALKSAFGVHGQKLTRQTNALTLTLGKPAPGLVPSTTKAYSMRSAPGELNGVSMSTAQIARALELRLQTPVIDETGLTNRYDITLKWTHFPVEVADRELVTALQGQLGLELKAAIRPVEFWVVQAGQ